MQYWFSADYHLGHGNIIKHCKRPFKSVDEMNKAIIARHNERVKPEDTVFFIGDFMFRNSAGGKKGEGLIHKSDYYLNKLNGKFVFVKGNHDRNNSLKTIIENVVIRIDNKRINLVHDPKHFNKDCKVNFVGHIHNEWEVKEINGIYCINVGVDVWDFYPRTYDELMKRFRTWKRKNEQPKRDTESKPVAKRKRKIKKTR